MTARSIAKLVGTIHNVSYYAPEMKAFADLGLREYWRAYMAYRSAPLGVVPASAVQAMFYNFAPAYVAAAIPSAWDMTTPAEVIALRDDCISAALHRGLDPGASVGIDHATFEEAADLLLPAILSCGAGARPLFAAHRDLPVPSEPLLRLWHVCTLWREYRGDGHNIALAAANIDGIECHVLLAAKGVGHQKIIETIRGWTLADWEAARQRLSERKLLNSSGGFTDAGETLRRSIEEHTDVLCGPALAQLTTATVDRATALLEPVAGQLIANGVVPGTWPPPQAMQ